MNVEGITPVTVARMFQPSTANVNRPVANSNDEFILERLDGAKKSFTKLRNNHAGHAKDPNLPS